MITIHKQDKGTLSIFEGADFPATLTTYQEWYMREEGMYREWEKAVKNTEILVTSKSQKLKEAFLKSRMTALFISDGKKYGVDLIAAEMNTNLENDKQNATFIVDGKPRLIE